MKSFASSALIQCLLLAVAPLLGSSLAAQTSAPQETASGHYQDDGERITFTHATAIAIDNAEGMDDPPKIRVFLSDRTVPAASLAGVTGLAVADLAPEAVTTGLLVEFDPDSPESVTLRPILGGGESVSAVSVTNSKGVWKDLSQPSGRIKGTMRTGRHRDYAVSFDAPVQTVPVVEILTGEKARASEFVRIALERADAVLEGDFDRALALSTVASGAKFAKMTPASRKRMQGMVRHIRPQIAEIDRVVIRERSATAIGGNGIFFRFVRQDGGWKID